MLKPCAPAWVTHPPTACSAMLGSILERLITSTCVAPRMSAARKPESQPLRLPIGVRTASTITGCAIVDVPSAANPGPGPVAPGGRYVGNLGNLEPVLIISFGVRVGLGCPELPDADQACLRISRAMTTFCTWLVPS